MAIRSNAKEIARKMQRRGPAIERGLERAARTLADESQKESRRILQVKVYNVPVPLNEKSLPKWQRTRDLLLSEKSYPAGPDVYMVNDSDHAIARAELGFPGGRKIVSPGIQRVDWQAEAAANLRRRVREVRRRAVIDAMRRA
jgi:hypothetical protein